MLAEHVITTATPNERRAHRRFIASELRGLRTARVKYGQDVSVIDISSGGVLFETTGELKPDSTIVLEFAAANRTFLVPSRVVRCHELGTFDSNPRLEGACVFRRPLPIDDLVGGSVAAVAPKRTASRDISLSSGWQQVIGKYRDGRTVRGYTNDFSPTRPYLHVSPTPLANETKFVSMVHLDALFFLSDPNLPVTEHESTDRGSSTTRGRRVAMTLPNGQEIIGTTLTYSRDGSGFFVRPLDSGAGATRVFVTQSGVRNIRFL